MFMCDFNNYFQTFETSAHFPYTDQFKASEIKITKPLLQQGQYFKPYAYEKTITLRDGRMVNYSCNTNIIAIKLYNGYPFDRTAELRIKYMLAKGIAVEGAMQASQSAKFQLYTRGILDESYECNYQLDLDHAVLIAGYGKYKGVDVWVFRNSWGEEFGHKGYFYVKIGSNALCTEMEALASLPAALPEDQF